MVNASTQQSASNVQRTLAQRDVVSIATIAVSTAGGVIVAQVVADRVLPMLQMNQNPSTASEFAASAGVKTGLSLALGFAAANVSGLPMIALAFQAVGALASAGADVLEMVQGVAPSTGSMTHAANHMNAAVGHGGSGNLNSPKQSRPSSAAPSAL